MSLPYKEPGLVELIEALDAVDAAEEHLRESSKALREKVKLARMRAKAIRDVAAGKDTQVPLPYDAQASAALARAREINETARLHGIQLVPPEAT